MTPPDQNDLDFDVEMFNPAKSRLRYQERGYDAGMIDQLVKYDTMLYSLPHDVLRAVVAQRRAEGIDDGAT